MCRGFSLLVVPFLAAALPMAMAETTEAPASADEQTLRAAGLATDGPALLDFFQARSRPASDGKEVQALVRQLGAAPEVRAHAAAQLVACGPLAVPALRHAVNDLTDPVAAKEAQKCLQWIEGSSAATIPAAAARLLAERRPPGAAEVLLAYVPFADNAEVAEEVAHALARLAFAQGQAAPALVRALEDALPARRAVAAEALCRADRPEQWPAVRKLLQDPNAAVRLRAALALVKQQDAEAVPVLIDLLAELPAVQRARIETALQELAGEWAPAMPQMKEDAISRRICRDAWAAWWRHTDGPALLDEFRQRTPDEAAQKKIQGLIDDLGAERFTVRERALADLAALGPVAVPFLRQAVRGKDQERARRAESCLARIAREQKRALPTAAPRLLALRRPPGAVEALLAYLPWAASEEMGQAVEDALAALAVTAGRPRPALVQALADPLPLRRRAAGVALARAGGATLRPALRKLLHDPEAQVRIGVGTALVAAGDREAMPVLIEALGDVPQDQGSQVLDMLYQLAGDKGPDVPAGTDAASRQKCRDAWAAWWKTHAAAVDLARLGTDQPLLGYTLLAEILMNNSMGRVREITRDGKTRWQIDGLQFPVDAFVRAGHVVIAECHGSRVSERDFKGTIIWKVEGLPGNALNVQPVPGGNTFIAATFAVMEVDRKGKEVYRVSFQGEPLTAACKMPDGHITVLTQQGQCVRVDTKGKQLKRFASGRIGGWTSGIDVVPGGRVLVARPNLNQVAELDRDGKTLWKAPAPGITTATSLRNGHVLAASHTNMRVQELDRAGRVVWEYRSDHHIFHARRR
jgi:HEAT repeat protein